MCLTIKQEDQHFEINRRGRLRERGRGRGTGRGRERERAIERSRGNKSEIEMK